MSEMDINDFRREISGEDMHDIVHHLTEIRKRMEIQKESHFIMLVHLSKIQTIIDKVFK